jgi:hypothetical protein
MLLDLEAQRVTGRRRERERMRDRVGWGRKEREEEERKNPVPVGPPARGPMWPVESFCLNSRHFGTVFITCRMWSLLVLQQMTKSSLKT